MAGIRLFQISKHFFVSTTSADSNYGGRKFKERNARRQLTSGDAAEYHEKLPVSYCKEEVVYVFVRRGAVSVYIINLFHHFAGISNSLYLYQLTALTLGLNRRLKRKNQFVTTNTAQNTSFCSLSLSVGSTTCSTSKDVGLKRY